MPTFYAGQPDYIAKLNELDGKATVSLTGTSTDSLSLSVGTKSFTTDTLLQLHPTSDIKIVRTSDVTKYMYGTVTTYNQDTGAMVADVQGVNGSGTFSDWTITSSGQKGAKGLNAKGAWNETTAYVADDWVTYSGSSYYRKVSGTTATAPDVDTTNWGILAQKGDASDITADTLAASSGASLIGFIANGVGASATTVQTVLRGDNVPIPPERGYWNEIGGGVNIHRLRDRVFIGDGAVSSGNKFQSGSETWITSDIEAYWIERGAQLLSISSYGQFGCVGASRTSDQDLHNHGTAAIGVVGLANNDRTSGAGIAWAGYFEANRQSSVPSGQGTTFGTEVAVKNKGNDVINNPYNKMPGGSTIGDWFAAGGDESYNGTPANPSTCAILIGKNSTTWNKGIVFDAVGITGTDGVNGTGVAISMAKGHVLQWQVAGGLEGASIYSDVNSNSQRSGLILKNNQIWVTVAGQITGTIEKGSGTASYLRMISSATGGAAQIQVSSTDTNSDLLLVPQGTGTVRFGFFTSNADAAINGYIGIKDAAGNFRKLATIA